MKFLKEGMHAHIAWIVPIVVLGIILGFMVYGLFDS